MNNQNFYKKLPGFTDIHDLTNELNFVDVPEDWLVVLTDIKNSTQAIQNGRYKDVNIIGASCIIAAKNACGDLEFPYIFGGDGATMIVPFSYKEKVGKALSHARDVALRQFQLELRVALIPMSHIYGSKKEIKVAKYIPNEGNQIAMFSGGGVTYAEQLAKQKVSDKEWLCEYSPEGDFAGLECRWNPVAATKDGVLTLIIQPTKNTSAQNPVLKNILEQMSGIALTSQPVTLNNLKEDAKPKDLMSEAKVKFKSKWAQNFYVFRIQILLKLFLKIIQAKKTQTDSGVYKYLHQLTMSTDYIKFDDSLRMVLDISNVEKEIILALLEKYRQQGEIVYGTNWSSVTLMTCYIQSQTKHVHFVDGGSGGYTMAAVQLKEQRKNLAS